jgi:hypothetical protein
MASENATMANGRPHPVTGDNAYVIATLQAQVVNLSTDMQEFRTQFNSAIAGINSKLDERGRIQWPAWTVAVSVTIAIGGLAFYPVTREQDKLWTAVDRINAVIVPREEHSEKWHSFDIQHADLKARIQQGEDNLQRQITDLQRSEMDVYTARDALIDEKHHVDELEKEFHELLGRIPPLSPKLSDRGAFD